jgi:pimeloyl-ACP methyl ester carboxylesterase
MPYVELKGGSKMWYIEKGAGMPVVLVHGSLCNSRFLENQVQHLGERFRAIAFDLPGHGKSDSPSGASYSFPELAASLEEGISRLVGENRIVLVGHSVGGMISLVYATTPDLAKRLRGLVLISTHPKSRDPGDLEFIKRVERGEMKIMDRKLMEPINTYRWFTSGYAKEHKSRLKELFDQVYMTSEEVAFKITRNAVYDYDVEDRLERIAVPTLIVTGDKDMAVPPHYSKLMHTKIRNSELLQVPNTGHMIQFEANEQLNRALSDFLKRIK